LRNPSIIRLSALLLGGSLFLGTVVVPAAASNRVQPKVDVIVQPNSLGEDGTVFYKNLVNNSDAGQGPVFCRGANVAMTIDGPGLTDITTSGDVQVDFNPTLGRFEITIVFGEVNATQIPFSGAIQVSMATPLDNMYTSTGGCGKVISWGEGTVRVGPQIFTGERFAATPFKKKFHSNGANCP